MENKYMVYEYNEKASPAYRGTRFITLFDEGDTNSNIDERVKIIALNISEEDANELVMRVAEKNANAFLNDLPIELRSPDMDKFIKDLINGN